MLRAYRRALLADDAALAEGLIAWLGGQPNVAAAAKRAAGVKGDLDPFGAMHSLAGLLTILRDSGRPGLVLVLDEVETLQRMRADTREKDLNALRQLLDEMDLRSRIRDCFCLLQERLLFSMGLRAFSGSPLWRNVSTRTLPPTRGSITRGPFKYGFRVSI